MITGFEEITKELTARELTIFVPAVVDILKNKNGEENAITSNRAIRLLIDELDIVIAQPTFRKIINHIRVNGLVENLVASSCGYYIAGTRSECQRYLESLGQRIRSMEMIHDALEFQMKQSLNGEIPFKN